MVLNGDNLEMSLEVPKDRFLFLKAEDGRIYHCDLADGNMFQAKDDLSNLGHAHQMLLREGIGLK